MTTIASTPHARDTLPPTDPLVSMGFNFSLPKEELAETIDAWTDYIDRLTRDSGRDPLLKPYVIQALLRRGIAHATLKQWESSIADFKRVLAEQVEAEEGRAANLLLGGIYTELCRDEEAIECWTSVLVEYERASRKEAKLYAEQFPRLYLYRGMLYGRLKRYLEAIADCDRAQKFAPDHAEIYSVRGISYAYLGDLERALSECLHAIELAPQATDYNRLGEVYLLRAEYLSALAAFERAVELDPTDETFRSNRSKALWYAMMSQPLSDEQTGVREEDEGNAVIAHELRETVVEQP